MLRLILVRLTISVPVLLGILIVGFLLVQILPSDPAMALAGPEASDQEIEAVRRRMGLDRPILEQFSLYFVRVVQLDLGRSLISNLPVTSELSRAFWPTAELMLACTIWAVPGGVALGTLSGVFRGSLFDRVVMAVSVAGISMPVFLIALLLLTYVGLPLGIPFQGRGGPLWTSGGLAHVFLPALTLGFLLIGPIARMTRAALLEVLQSDYIRTARAKGLSETAVVLRHGLRNAMIPVITIIGMQVAFLLGGAVVTESVFAWPGIGRLAVGAISSQDFPVAQGAIMIMAVAFLGINLIVDVLYGVLDPRAGKR